VNIITVNSPGKEGEDLKNQDSVHTERADNMLYAIVCDGVTSSAYSEEGARYAAQHVVQLFTSDGLESVVRELESMRLSLSKKPILFPPGASEAMKLVYEEVIKDKRKNAYQTTFMSVKIEPPNTITALGCGDSACFIFEPSGKLLHTNLAVKREKDPLPFSSVPTLVIPDSFKIGTKAFFHFEGQFKQPIEILVCSDGFYGAFSSFEEIFQWLKKNKSSLTNDTQKSSAMESLHTKLNHDKGDDDISLIWLF
jgi:serine/threonine protein phosphatase PrpC